MSFTTDQTTSGEQFAILLASCRDRETTAQALAKPPPDHAAGLAADYTTSRDGSEEADGHLTSASAPPGPPGYDMPAASTARGGVIEAAD